MDLDEILQQQAYMLIYQKKSVKVAWIDGETIFQSNHLNAT